MTGVSGSGKTTLVLESLVPALQAHIAGTKLPAHILSVEAEGIRQVKLIDATPIGVNVRSTVATYANVHFFISLTLSLQAALSGMRRDGRNRARRPIPAGCGHPLSGLSGVALREGGGRDSLHEQTRRLPLAA